MVFKPTYLVREYSPLTVHKYLRSTCFANIFGIVEVDVDGYFRPAATKKKRLVNV
jgi:hypothetical protein